MLATQSSWKVLRCHPLHIFVNISDSFSTSATGPQAHP